MKSRTRTYTVEAITRRSQSALRAAVKAFASYRLGDGVEPLMVALCRLDRVEDDVRYLADREAGYAAVKAARTAIRSAWAAAHEAAKVANQNELDKLNLLEWHRRHDDFASRCNWNLSGGR